MKKTKLDKIPSVFKNIDLPTEVNTGSKIKSEEGEMVVVEALENEGKNDVFEFVGGRLGKLVKGDVIPAVLGYRKAPVEFAGLVPRNVKAGEELYLLCESGLVGKISGVYEAWGKPMKVKVLGALVDDKGKQMSLKDYKLKTIKGNLKNVPVICLISTRMDTGKTIMAAKIGNAFSKKKKKVAAIKPTGVAFCQDPYKLRDYGVNPVLDFVDMGLPSTCSGNAQEVVESTKNLLNHVKALKADLVILEFGEGLIGEYHVADILSDKQVKNQISYLILAANDFSGIYGAQEILKGYGLKIDLVTGPIANSKVGVDLIKKNFNLEAVSNQHDIKKAVISIQNKLFSKKRK